MFGIDIERVRLVLEAKNWDYIHVSGSAKVIRIEQPVTTLYIVHKILYFCTNTKIMIL